MTENEIATIVVDVSYHIHRTSRSGSQEDTANLPAAVRLPTGIADQFRRRTDQNGNHKGRKWAAVNYLLAPQSWVIRRREETILTHAKAQSSQRGKHEPWRLCALA